METSGAPALRRSRGFAATTCLRVLWNTHSGRDLVTVTRFGAGTAAGAHPPFPSGSQPPQSLLTLESEVRVHCEAGCDFQ
jgi:hypothetical protein